MDNIIDKVRGKVTYIERDLGVKITIEDDNYELHDVRLPVNISNEFELIPYQLALSEQLVRYQHTVKTHTSGKSKTHFDHYELDILSGPCMGNKYVVKQ